MVFIPGSRLRGEGVSVGIGGFESVVCIRDFRKWAWVGFLLKNPTDRRLVIRRGKTSVVTVPPLPRVRVFLYGPICDCDLARLWEGVDADYMRDRLLSVGNPIPERAPAGEVALSGGDWAVVWIYLEDEYIDEVSVLVNISVEEG